MTITMMKRSSDVRTQTTAGLRPVTALRRGRHHHTWQELSVEQDEFGLVRQCMCECGELRYDDRAVA